MTRIKRCGGGEAYTPWFPPCTLETTEEKIKEKRVTILRIELYLFKSTWTRCNNKMFRCPVADVAVVADDTAYHTSRTINTQRRNKEESV